MVTRMGLLTSSSRATVARRNSSCSCGLCVVSSATLRAYAWNGAMGLSAASVRTRGKSIVRMTSSKTKLMSPDPGRSLARYSRERT